MTRVFATLLLGLALAGPGRAGEEEIPAPVRPVKTLAECVALALERHPSIGAASEDLEAGRARIYEAGSGYLPQLSGSWSTDRRKSTFSSRTGGPGGGSRTATHFNFHEGAVTLSQTLFDFGQTLAGIRAAQARGESLAADAETTRQQVILEVKQAYYGLLAARRLLAVADETVRANRKQLEQARGRNQVGFSPRLDVTRSEVQLANAELDQLSARNSVAVAEVTLANALGMEGHLDFDIADTLSAHKLSLEEPDALERAYSSRPDLRSLLAQQRAAEEDAAQRTRELLPSVRGDASYGGSGSVAPPEEQWSAGVAVVVPIFDGGLTLARMREARAQSRALAFQEQQLRQQIAREVRTALLDVARSSESIEVTERAADQADQNLALAEGRYETGVGNVIELTDAQSTRASAQADRVRALYDHETAIAVLEQAMGEALQEP